MPLKHQYLYLLQIRPSDLLAADRLFAPLGHITTAQSTHAPLLLLMNEARKKQQQQQQSQNNSLLSSITPEVSLGKVGLIYNPDLMESRANVSPDVRLESPSQLR